MTDAVAAAVAKTLRDRGVPMHQVARVVQLIQGRDLEQLGRMAIVARLPDEYVVREIARLGSEVLNIPLNADGEPLLRGPLPKSPAAREALAQHVADRIYAEGVRRYTPRTQDVRFELMPEGRELTALQRNDPAAFIMSLADLVKHTTQVAMSVSTTGQKGRKRN